MYSATWECCIHGYDYAIVVGLHKMVNLQVHVMTYRCSFYDINKSSLKKYEPLMFMMPIIWCDPKNDVCMIDGHTMVH